jgi:hypothetical protein
MFKSRNISPLRPIEVPKLEYIGNSEEYSEIDLTIVSEPAKYSKR